MGIHDLHRLVEIKSTAHFLEHHLRICSRSLAQEIADAARACWPIAGSRSWKERSFKALKPTAQILLVVAGYISIGI